MLVGVCRYVDWVWLWVLIERVGVYTMVSEFGGDLVVRFWFVVIVLVW